MNRFVRVGGIPGIPDPGTVVLIKGGIGSFPHARIPAGERMRAENMLSRQAREAFLAGRRTVRMVLGEWLSLGSETVPLRLDEGGRPVLDLPADESGALHFSISHTGAEVWVVFSREQVGLDVERNRPVDAEALAQRYFSKEEAALVARDESQFFSLWTCREAAIKADGRGMAFLLASTRATILPRSASVTIGDDPWEVLVWREGELHAAVAARSLPDLILWSDSR